MKKNYLLIIFFFIFCFEYLNAQPVSQTFNTNQTYTVPAGYIAIVTIEAWGGGGSGGGGNTTNNSRTGGGGGAYANVTGQALMPGNYAVTVGAGGIAPANVNTGQNGGNSSFTTLVIAAGGSGGSNAFPGPAGAGGTIAASTGTTKYAGGNGGFRQNTGAGGGGGGSATTTAAGGVGGAGASGIGGAGGTGTGAGGKGGNTGQVANNGVVPGGGGGGKGFLANTSGNGANGLVVVTVTSFSVLAIHFNYFNANTNDGVNTLNWQAICSSTQAVFEVERSTDGRNFILLNTIIADQSLCMKPFSYTDNSNITGQVFYRIKSIDKDGSITYSAIIKLNTQLKSKKKLALLPNPVSNMAQLYIYSDKQDKLEINIHSMDGKIALIKSIPIQKGNSIISFDVSNLRNAMYTLNGIFGDGKNVSLKFIKQ